MSSNLFVYMLQLRCFFTHEIMFCIKKILISNEPGVVICYEPLDLL